MIKIESISQIEMINDGDIIMDNSSGKMEEYCIQKINETAVYLVHSDGVVALKVVPVEDLITSDWWLKK